MRARTAQIGAVTVAGLMCLAGCETPLATAISEYAQQAAPTVTPAATDRESDTPGPSKFSFLHQPGSGRRSPTPAATQAPVAPPAPVPTSTLSLWGDLPAGGEGEADGADNLRQVTFTREGRDFDPDIHPQGKLLVFASTQHRATSDLYVKDVRGQTITQFTSDPGNDLMPAFSRDGKSVAFASDRTGNLDIFIRPLSGGPPVQVSSDPAHEVHPSWSPDGQQLVFSLRSTKSGQWEMVLVDVANPANRRFIGFGLFPKFSPDGRKIVFQRPRYRGGRTFSIWTVDLVAGEGRNPTEIAAAANAAVINPTWAPDGRRLAFATVIAPPADPNQAPGRADLWTINVNGTNRVKLTTDQHANLQPAWSVDGTIYFMSNRSGHDNVWALPVGRAPAVVAEPAAPTPQAAVPTP
ncbi:MAG: hypothetical protein OER86_00865 [Phycisphaerae bacterium]|nr:hypothetical protein [Phycisphaerae bacterium]